jgi:biopolymer transport protein ExbD
MITRPLDLESRLSPPPRDFTAVAWVNAGVIALFFTLLGSRFVLAPGLLIELPTMDPASMSAVETSVVVNYRRDGVILFGTGMYSPAELQAALEEYVRKHPASKGSTLQVNADKQVSTQALTNLGDIAAAAGFAKMVVAGRERPAADNPPK